MKSELRKFSLFNFEIPLGTQNCSLKIAHKYDDYKYMLKHITLLFFVKENYITKVYFKIIGQATKGVW